MTYLNDESFTALFDDVESNWELICLGLAHLSKELSRQWKFPTFGDVRRDRIQTATVDCLLAVPEFTGGSAFSYFSSVAVNSFKMGLRASQAPHNSPFTNMTFDGVEPRNYYRFVELLPGHGQSRRPRGNRK